MDTSQGPQPFQLQEFVIPTDSEGRKPHLKETRKSSGPAQAMLSAVEVCFSPGPSVGLCPLSVTPGVKLYRKQSTGHSRMGCYPLGVPTSPRAGKLNMVLHLPLPQAAPLCLVLTPAPCIRGISEHGAAASGQLLPSTALRGCVYTWRREGSRGRDGPGLGFTAAPGCADLRVQSRLLPSTCETHIRETGRSMRPTRHRANPGPSFTEEAAIPCLRGAGWSGRCVQRKQLPPWGWRALLPTTLPDHASAGLVHTHAVPAPTENTLHSAARRKFPTG